MLRFLPVLFAAVILVLSGILHGVRTDRWRASAARSEAAERIATIPRTIGGWIGEDIVLDQRQLQLAEADAHLARRYRRGAMDEVTVVLLSGRAAPLAVHTPDVCFEGSGYRLTVGPQRWRANSEDVPKSEFWTARFSRAPEPALQVYWAWSDGGPWTAAGDARLAFNRSPALHKLYLICRPQSHADGELPDAVQEFMPELLTELHRRLTSP